VGNSHGYGHRFFPGHIQSSWKKSPIRLETIFNCLCHCRRSGKTLNMLNWGYFQVRSLPGPWDISFVYIQTYSHWISVFNIILRSQNKKRRLKNQLVIPTFSGMVPDGPNELREKDCLLNDLTNSGLLYQIFRNDSLSRFIFIIRRLLWTDMY